MVHGGLGQVLSASSGRIQQHATLDNRNQSLHDVQGQTEDCAVDILLSRIRRTKNFTLGLRERGNQETTREWIYADKIKSEEIVVEMVSKGDLFPSQDWQIKGCHESFWQEDHSVPEREMDLEQIGSEVKEPTNLRFLVWILAYQ